jgi:hypothetical protein
MDTAEVGYGLGLGINVEADIGYPLVTITRACFINRYGLRKDTYG